MGSVTPSPLDKKGELLNNYMDSTRWNNFPWRSDDVVIATYAKSGTTWTQQIMAQLLSQGDANHKLGGESPWVDMRLVPIDNIVEKVEAQKGRRFLKTHLPFDNMVYNPDVKYIFIARDGRDVMWSFHHHLSIMTDEFINMLNAVPGAESNPTVRPSDDPYSLFASLLGDEKELPWPYWDHMRQWWTAREAPNVLFVHFADLKADLHGEMRRIADFLDIDIAEDKMELAVKHSTFDWMKENAHVITTPEAEALFKGGARNFINKGTNGRWKDRLTEEDNANFIARARSELGEECAKWMEKGRLG